MATKSNAKSAMRPRDEHRHIAEVDTVLLRQHDTLLARPLVLLRPCAGAADEADASFPAVVQTATVAVDYAVRVGRGLATALS